MYLVADQKFTSFSAAVEVAHAKGIEVVEEATGLTRWRPASKPASARKQHVLVEEDGTVRPFSRVVRR